VQDDFQRHAQEIRGVPDAHTASLSKAACRSTIEPVSECPFGDDFQSERVGGFNTVFVSEALQQHVAAHLKDIALLSLQKLPSKEREQSKFLSGAATQDGGDGILGRRRSMDSILDKGDSLIFEDMDIEPSQLLPQQPHLSIENLETFNKTIERPNPLQGDLDLGGSLAFDDSVPPSQRILANEADNNAAEADKQASLDTPREEDHSSGGDHGSEGEFGASRSTTVRRNTHLTRSTMYHCGWKLAIFSVSWRLTCRLIV
jgi:hypothetical protein